MTGPRPRSPDPGDDPDVDGLAAIVYRCETAIQHAYDRVLRAFDPVVNALQSAFGPWWAVVVGVAGAVVAVPLLVTFHWVAVWLIDAGGLIGVMIVLYVVLMAAHAVFRR